MDNIKLIRSVLIDEEQYLVGWDDKTGKVYIVKGAVITKWNDTQKVAATEEDAKSHAVDYLQGKL